MKIKLAILEKDQSYLNRIVSVFTTKYTDKFEVYSFTDLQVALSYLENAKIDVFTANDYFEIDLQRIPKRCGFAYLVDSADIEMENNQRAIFKFQKADLIYKQILGIYSEKAGSLTGLKLDDDSTKILAFTSVSGGVGSSSIAAAAAVHYAAQGKKTLYLNLEKFGSADVFFCSEGQFDMSDIVFALKSKKANLGLKLESCVKQDASGVYFYSQAKVALDILELNIEEILCLISEIKLSGDYDYIIIDFDFSMDKDTLKICREAHGIIWVSDGTDISNLKTTRAFQAISIMEKSQESPLTNRISVIYNRFSSTSGKTIENSEIRVVGGAPVYKGAATAQLIMKLASLDAFDKLI